MKMKTDETKVCGIQGKQCSEEICGIPMLILEKPDLKLMIYTFTLKKKNQKKENPTGVISNTHNNRNK